MPNDETVYQRNIRLNPHLISHLVLRRGGCLCPFDYPPGGKIPRRLKPSAAVNCPLHDEDGFNRRVESREIPNG